MRVFATRPAVQNTAWIAKLEAEAWSAVALPLLNIEAVSLEDDPSLRTRLLRLDEFDTLIFVSQNAVQFGAEAIDTLWPQFPVGLHGFAIGEKTARALRDALPELGEVRTCAAMHSQALLSLPELQDMRDRKVLVFRGVGGLPTISTVLRERGASLEHAELYHRRVPASLDHDLAHLELSEHDILPVFSGEALQNFHAAAERCHLDVSAIPLIAPGERVCDLASSLGFTRIYRAENASEAAMLSTLRTEFKI